ncbi:helix-turn-helix domain-containing protein [Streptomyces mayteni]
MADPYSSPRTFYGAELKRLREDAELTQDELGHKAFCSGSYIGQFEAAFRRPQTDFSVKFDEIFGTAEHFQRLCRLAHESEKHPDYFVHAAELEKVAKTISEYAPTLVPGLLQTESYARALTRATLPLAPDEEVEKHVRNRLERQKLLHREKAPEFWAVLYEAALRVPFGGPDAMADQLAHIVELARTRRIRVQVLPFSSATDALMGNMLSLMTFAEEPPVAYSEGAHTGQLIEDLELVERYRHSYDLIRAAALSPTASLTLLESAAEDLTT